MFDPDEGRWLYPRNVIAAVQSWDVNTATASVETAEAPEDQQAGQSQTEPGPVEFPPAENRRRLRAVRDAYHRRYFPAPRQ